MVRSSVSLYGVHLTIAHFQLSLFSSQGKVFTGNASATQASADWLALHLINIFDRMSDIPGNREKIYVAVNVISDFPHIQLKK